MSTSVKDDQGRFVLVVEQDQVRVGDRQHAPVEALRQRNLLVRLDVAIVEFGLERRDASNGRRRFVIVRGDGQIGHRARYRLRQQTASRRRMRTVCLMMNGRLRGRHRRGQARGMFDRGIVVRIIGRVAHGGWLMSNGTQAFRMVALPVGVLSHGTVTGRSGHFNVVGVRDR